MPLTIYAQPMQHDPDYGYEYGRVAYTLTPTRTVAAVVEGPVEPCELGFGVMGAALDGEHYALRDILSLAQQGERGLSIRGA